MKAGKLVTFTVVIINHHEPINVRFFFIKTFFINLNSEKFFFIQRVLFALFHFSMNVNAVGLEIEHLFMAMAHCQSSIITVNEVFATYDGNPRLMDVKEKHVRRRSI